ncbi:MAG: L-fucose:H+ symporter permease [Salibacteraceae bacterium]
MKLNERTGAFVLILALFFMWGFITSLNDILIPHLKKVFDLGYSHAMLVQFAFFGAYLLVSIPASRLIGRTGYSRGIVVGLCLMAAGCATFIPSALMANYLLFLLALFVLAAGITVLQVAANPYVTILGPADSGSVRLNLSQGINSLAHTLAPVAGTLLILQGGDTFTAEGVIGPYTMLALVCGLLALLFFWVKLPDAAEKQSGLGNGHIPRAFKHVWFGVLAIFLYVGIEVSIGGFIVNFLGEKSIASMPQHIAGHYVAYYWGAAMVGRFAGAWVLRYIQSWQLLAVAATCNLCLIGIVVIGSGSLAQWSLLSIGLFNSVMFPTIFSMAIKGLGPLTSRASGYLVTAISGGAFVPLFQGLLADKWGVQASFAIGFFCFGYVLWYALSWNRFLAGVAIGSSNRTDEVTT